jgi:hypothetical protein
LQGERIFHLTDDLNSIRHKDSFSEFFAELQNKNVNFITPCFEEGDERYRNLQKCVRMFQIIMPGVEFLGDGYYVIPDDKLNLFEKVIDTKTEVLPAGQEFTAVIERSKNITKGRIIVDGYEYEAYMTEDGRVVINKPYK